MRDRRGPHDLAPRRLLACLALCIGAVCTVGRADPSLMLGVPWEMLRRDTVVPHAVRPGWVERAIAICRWIPLEQAYERRGLSPARHPPLLHVYKAQFAMVVLAGERPLKIYPVALSGTPIGTKLRLGDRRTPEGTYKILKHVSPTYGMSFYVCYPNWVDAFRGLLTNEITYRQFLMIERALTVGVPPPQDTPLGAQILIHTSRTRRDSCVTCDNWTMGCIAMEPEDLGELLAVVPWGQTVTLTIHPVDVPLDPTLVDPIFQDLP